MPNLCRNICNNFYICQYYVCVSNFEYGFMIVFDHLFGFDVYFESLKSPYFNIRNTSKVLSTQYNQSLSKKKPVIKFCNNFCTYEPFENIQTQECTCCKKMTTTKHYDFKEDFVQTEINLFRLMRDISAQLVMIFLKHFILYILVQSLKTN
jgi:hypothetical protein